MTIEELIISSICGGLIGTIVSVVANIIYMQHRKKVDLSINIINDYFHKFNEIGNVESLLKNPPVLDENAGELNVYRNLIKNVGNWYELVAYLYMNEELDFKIMNGSKLPELIADFGDKIKTSDFNWDKKPTWENIDLLEIRKGGKQ